MIPCYITIRDLITWPLEMLPHIERLGMFPILCDHGSTYPPCVDYLRSSQYEVRRYENEGCYGFFTRGGLKTHCGWCVVTDSDLDLSGVPDDFVQVAMDTYKRHPDVMKVGLSLEIDDVPKSAVSYDIMHDFEDHYWKILTMDGHWRAGIGATMALYHPERANHENFYSAIRLRRPYTARHLPWYLTKKDISQNEEYRYYLEHADHLPVFTNHIKRQVG